MAISEATRRQIERAKAEDRARLIKKMDGYYFRQLNLMIDRLFEIAAKKEWTWEQIAEESGLRGSTIAKLGTRKTKYPQYRTVELLARALGGRLEYTKGTGAQGGAIVKLKMWNLGGRRKKKKAA